LFKYGANSRPYQFYHEPGGAKARPPIWHHGFWPGWSQDRVQPNLHREPKPGWSHSASDPNFTKAHLLAFCTFTRAYRRPCAKRGHGTVGRPFTRARSPSA
jgi:hypothetical protein